MTKKTKKRGAYKCTKCREYGHRANKCPKKYRMEMLLNSLPGDIALGSLIPEFFQVLAVIEGNAGQAIVNIIKGNERLVEQGLPPSNSMVNAWTELAVRAAKVPPDVIALAKTARITLNEAEAAFAAAIAPIKEALGHKSPSGLRTKGDK